MIQFNISHLITVKLFQVLLFDTTSFICSQLNGFKYRKGFNISI